MLVDYLRYLAFEGRLRSFFQDPDILFNYVDPSDTTGQHLRFAPDYLYKQFGWRVKEVIKDRYWDDRYIFDTYNLHLREFVVEGLMHQMRLTGGPDSLIAPPFKLGGPPIIFTYKEEDSMIPGLQIIVDIAPNKWSPRYSERQEYEDVPVLYRRAGPARADFQSGDKVFDREKGPSRHGTLCGFFRDTKGDVFALTCGHVASTPGSQVVVHKRHRIWKLPIWSTTEKLGQILQVAECEPASSYAPVRVHLDAALIEVNNTGFVAIGQKIEGHAKIKPISAMLQEEPVRFRGSGRNTDTLARVSAVTVRKSIDLFRDGTLRNVGDVLMLGHRHPPYISQRVSRRGDSGAAVHQNVPSTGPFSQLRQWHGMVLGSDDGGAYATYAEYLLGWAQQEIGDLEIEFVFETS